jgi:MFS family permease
MRELVLPVFVPSLIFSAGENVLLPMIPAGAEKLGANLTAASLVAGMIMVGTLIADLPAAKFVARIGERKGMILASLLAALGLVISAFANNIWLLGLGVLIVGMCASTFALARHTYMAGAVPYNVRARASSTLGGMFRAGGLLGPFIAAALLILGDFKFIYWGAALLCLIAGSVLFFAKTDESADEANKTSFSTWHITKREWKKLSTLGVASAILAIVRTARIVGLPLWALYLKIDPATTSLLIGGAAVLDFALFYASGQVMDKWGRRAAAVPTLALMGITMFLLPFTTNATGLFWVALAMSLANGLGSGLIMTIGADLAPADARGEFLGAFRFLVDTAVALTAPVLAIASASIGLGYGFFFFGITSVVGAWIMWKHIPTFIQHTK